MAPSTTVLNESSSKSREKKPTNPKNSVRNRNHNVLKQLARIVLLDLPMAGILLGCASLAWLDHVHRSYLVPQIKALRWTPHRAATELTYYTRICDAADLTTRSSADLFLSLTATAQQAADHQLQHGFTVIQGVLSDETMTALRNHIDWRNRNEQSLYVIEGKHRASILLGTEAPVVREALEEIANHEQFRTSLEAMLGPNPALIEMTAISSSAGAVAQWWHADVDIGSSATNYARAFGPSYSVFIQLQNTTRAMGATAVCPGSYYCTSGPISAYCEDAGLQAVNGDGYSRGDAMIMNMNSFHRGAAHTDPTAPDRIMLVLTFSPQPVSRAETRQMSNGITFQLRWDMWGHTLNDMAAAHSVMRQPWVTLKSLGLYKRPDSDWGVDYIAASSQRYINNDNGFSRDDLDNFLEQGGFQWLPPFLQGKISGNEESWHEFLSRTIDLCLDFMKTVSIGVLCSYLASALILTIPVKPQQRLRFLRNAFLRLAAVGGSVFVLYLFAMNRVDESGWAKDLVAKRRFTSAVKHEQYFSEKGGNDPPGLLFAASSRHRSPRNSGGAVTTTPTNTDEWELLAEAPSTFPHRNDVLIETRLGSESFAMINSLIDGHPGNIVFRNLVASFNDYPAVFRDAMARYVTGTIHAGQGRFLYQQPHGTWVRLSLAQAEAYTKQLIWLGTNKVAAKAATVWIRHVFSHFRYGIYRDTALAMDHSRLFMKDLERKVLTTAISRTVTTVSVLHNNTTSAAFHRHRAFKQLPSLPSARSRVIEEAAHHGKTRLQAALSPTPTEPFPGAWLEEGDVIEVLFEGGDTSNDEPVWYGALIRRVFASGAYSVEFGDGDISNVDMYQIRRVKELKPGEVLGILMDDEGNYDDFQFVKQEEDGTLQARHLETGKMATGIELLYLRRVGGKAKRKPDINSPWQQGIEEGDLVEVLDADSGVWYTGLIQHIMTEGDHKYTVEYANGSSVVIGDVRLIRHIAEYQPGEIIEVRLENDDYYLCAFIGPMEDGTFKAVILTSNDVVEGFTAMDIGRTGRFVQ